ncbi:MAG: tRNA (adenosine(37)-N6)-dimethylallyltransferase MiaA [Chloroflexi bacterium]|nr:tRNA (adenosine(37)-N6)-dimethylallyltransferase MiaA [Chloroflexota bacterium]
MKQVVAIVGPTAIGKTELALRLAREFSGEIVNADSRQVYRYMHIGTAKPSKEEQSLVPHHLIDIVNPDDDFSLAQYQGMAYQAIDDIQLRGKLPLLVGGSGLYVWAVLEGWTIPPVAPDPEFRREMWSRATSGGADELYRELTEIDLAAAQKIDPSDVRRVIRALEVCRAGVLFSEAQRKDPPPFDGLIIGLTTDRAELYRRIDVRVDKMIEHDLIDEVAKLVDMGYGLDLPSTSGIGYKEIARYLGGELSLESAIEKIKLETHRVARHQYAWFRLSDKRIRWFDIGKDAYDEIRQVVGWFVAG